MTIKELLLPEFDQETAQTRRVLERVPEDRLDWQPHDRSMTLGHLASHIAEAYDWAGAIMDNTEFDLLEAMAEGFESTRAASRTELLELFDRCTTRARAALDRDDAGYAEPWTFIKGGQKMMTLPRVAAIRAFLLNHIVHHRGQLTVYLRLNDVPVPGMYGPSADEQREAETAV